MPNANRFRPSTPVWYKKAWAKHEQELAEPMPDKTIYRGDTETKAERQKYAGKPKKPQKSVDETPLFGTRTLL